MNKKFNIIDFVVLLFICAVIAFVGFKFVYKDTFSKDNISNSKFTAKDVVCLIKVGEVIDTTAEALPSSGEIYDESGDVIGEVLSKKVVDSEVIKVKNDGRYVKVTNPGKKDVYLEVKAQATVKDEGYYINQKVNMGAGSGATFKAKNIEFWGYIVTIEEK